MYYPADHGPLSSGILCLKTVEVANATCMPLLVFEQGGFVVEGQGVGYKGGKFAAFFLFLQVGVEQQAQISVLGA